MIVPDYDRLINKIDEPIIGTQKFFNKKKSLKVASDSMENLDFRCNKFNVGIRGYFAKEYLKDI
jgi:hypothetical protein